MPIYEYRCAACRRKQSFLVLSARSGLAPACKFCGSGDLVRLFSRVAVLRSEESRLESLADQSKWGHLDENDPRSLARFMKKMGEAVGEDLGDELDEALEEAEAGGEGEGAEAAGGESGAGE